ncbi:MFS transporter [Bacillus sp. SD088]|uniref:MFS transporter n=1 Tax=Bacillus sp. SD088 TaxID=2782012 RepID=UPI001A968D92|nr:MFS transporter [Bacillus sp. SD088]MBO0994928.1 MFS transporter [Bacillus sp. SD088]
MKKAVNKNLFFLLSVTCGAVVANIYYIQPIANHAAKTFSIGISSVGVLSMLTQLGYALGLLFLVPLGDLINRKKLIIRMSLLSTLSLLMAFLSPNFLLFAISSFLIGLLSIVPQIIIPYGASLVYKENRGRVTGQLLSGLLTGILLSRSVSGFVASYANWKMIYLLGFIVILILSMILYFNLPKEDHNISSGLSYFSSLKSIPFLIKSQKILQESVISGFFMFGTFSIFWSTLIFYISSSSYNWGSKEAGILALIGLSGAMCSPFAGRLADKISEKNIVFIGYAMQSVSFFILMLLGSNIVALVISIVLLDVGNQFGQVSNQTRVQKLRTEYASRNNTVFMFSYFIGGALGSLLGTTLWGQFGWIGVTILGLVFQAYGLTFHFVYGKKKKCIKLA